MVLSYVHVYGVFNPWRVAVARVHGGLHPKGPQSSNLDYSIMASVHKGLASLWVDLHEVGDLLAHTNFMFQLDNAK